MKRAVFVLAPLLAAALAQDKPTFSVDVKVVNLLATVRDAKGALINALTKDDFILEEDGKPQEIRYFSHQTNQPLTLGLLVDTSGSQRNLIDEEREASAKFLQQVMRTEDQGFLIKFDFDVELLQDLTSSRETLLKALDLLQSPVISRNTRPTLGSGGGSSRGGGGGGGIGSPFPRFPGGTVGWPTGGSRGGGPRGGGRSGPQGPGPGGHGGGGGTALYDAVFLASDEVLKTHPGRKAIILISDGVDRGSKLGIDEAIESCLRADAIVYSVRYADDAMQQRALGGAGADGKRTLENLATETGGREFEVNKKQTLEQIYTQIQDELRNQYSIGYSPADTSGSAFRAITLRTKDKKYKVQTRTGYYPKAS